MKFSIILISFLFTAIHTIFCQVTIEGKIVNEKKLPIVGANIYLKGTYEGSTSDEKGNFSISTGLPTDKTIVISFIGYKTQEIAVEPGKEKVSFTVILKENDEQIGEVVITAGQFEAGDEKKSFIMSTLEMVTSGSSVGDIYGAINSLPGLSVANEEGGLLVRGGEQYETKTFIDGMQVESPLTAKLPNVPARGRFSPMLFRGTVFSTGGYSAEYGEALSSALILNTTAIPKKNETDFCINSTGLYFSKTNQWENTSLAAISQYGNMKPYFKLTNPDIEWKDDPVSFNQTVVFRQKTGKNGLLKGMGTYGYENSSLYYYNVDNKNFDLVSTRNHNVLMMCTYKNELGNNWIIQSGVSFCYDNTNLGYNYNTLKNRIGSAEIKTALFKPLGKSVNLNFGFNTYIKDYIRTYAPTDIDTSSYHWQYQQITGSFFVETEIKLSKRISMRTGGRFEYHTLLKQKIVSPRFCIAYKVSPNSQFSGCYGQFSEQPQDENLVYNHLLHTENAEHYIVNYQYTGDKRIFRIEAYYKNYDHLVKYDSLYSVYPESYNNTGYGYAMGIDVFFRDNKTIKNGDYWISYSLMDSKRNYRDDQFSQTPYFISTHNLSVVYKHYFNVIGSYLSAEYNFASGRPYINPNNGFKQQHTIPYHNLSMSYYHFTKLFGKFFMFYCQVSNIPGFNQVFGYRYSKQPNADGIYESVPIKSIAKRFFFLGFYMSLEAKPEF